MFLECWSSVVDVGTILDQHKANVLCLLASRKAKHLQAQQTQNICMIFIQRWTSVEDVGPTLYKCYTIQMFCVCCKGVTIRFPGGEGGRSICRGQIIYFNRAQRRAENFKFCYMFIWNSSWSQLFISRRVRPKLFFLKILLPPPPPPWESNGGQITKYKAAAQCRIHLAEPYTWASRRTDTKNINLLLNVNCVFIHTCTSHIYKSVYKLQIGCSMISLVSSHL